MMRILVVTGGIGSGKSLVCRLLDKKYGIPVYEADARVKALYSEIPVMLDMIEEALDVNLKTENGEFVPRKLADVIFNDKAALQKVEDIVFPYLNEDFACWCKIQGREIVAFESATILEKPQLEGLGDIVLLIDAPITLRISRSISRDGQDVDRIMERISSQPLMNMLSEGGSCDRVNHTIVNDGSVDDLQEKIEKFVEKYELIKML